MSFPGEHASIRTDETLEACTNFLIHIEKEALKNGPVFMPKPKTMHPMMLKNDDYPARLRKVLEVSEFDMDVDELHTHGVSADKRKFILQEIQKNEEIDLQKSTEQAVRKSTIQDMRSSKVMAKDQDLLDILNTLDSKELPPGVRRTSYLKEKSSRDTSPSQVSIHSQLGLQPLKSSFY